jgi:general secretion pathway protein L
MLLTFFHWWIEQMAAFLPRSIGRYAGSEADAVVISPVGRLNRGVGSVAIGLRRRGRETELGRFGLGAGAPRDLPGIAGLSAVLRLDAADVLEKTVILPLAAERDLEQVLAFEMDRETPFTADELYWSHAIESADRQSGQLSVQLSLVPKGDLDPLLSSLTRLGLRPTRAEIGGGLRNRPYLPLDGHRGRLQQPSRRMVRVAAACFGVLALAAVVTPFVRQSLALAQLDREIAAGRSAADEARRLRSEIGRLSGGEELVERERDKIGRPLEALAAATRVLPDDTYLTEFAFRQKKVTLTGRSAAAARLIGGLAADGTFRNPAFAAPVTRVEALHAEVFTITAQVGPP